MPWRYIFQGISLDMEAYIMSKKETNMKVGDFSCELHMPNKLSQKVVNGEEIAQRLPPCSPVTPYPVDFYQGCPDNWMHGSDIAGSYFLGVEEDKGMWLNFNGCNALNHDVAIVISIQGINPITGLKTEAIRLEQYKKKCPIHDIDFQQDRFCSKCNFQWPAQNYITTTSTPDGRLWIDGFRRPDGTVRQYIFTADEMKGIAHQLIGKDKVYAIGIAFYLSKEKKPIKKANDVLRVASTKGSIPDYFKDEPLDYNPEVIWTTGKDEIYGVDQTNMDGSSSWNNNTYVYRPDKILYSQPVFFSPIHTPEHWNIIGSNATRSISSDSLNVTKSLTKGVVESKKSKTLEIGAGALINQRIFEDLNGLDFWRDEPSGMLYINYCDSVMLNNILNKGEIKQSQDGFMENLKMAH